MIEAKLPAISFHDLTLGYDRHPAVHHISGEVLRGDLLALVGPNGVGKSTLLKGVVGQLKPLACSLSLDGLKPSDIAYLSQQIDITRAALGAEQIASAVDEASTSVSLIVVHHRKNPEKNPE
jgi:ABC-type Mn2+/Zn2+ transport system ATPase subunit